MKSIAINFGDSQLGLTEVGNVRVKVCDRFTVLNKRVKIVLLFECTKCGRTRKMQTAGYKSDVQREIVSHLERFVQAHSHGAKEESTVESNRGRGDLSSA